MDYLVLAYYHFTNLPQPQKEVAAHKAFFKDKDVAGRIYISEEGINGQMSGAKQDALAYIDWMHSRPEFKDVEFKIHFYHENAFAKMVVKTRQQLVALDRKVDFSKRGKSLNAKEWKAMLEEKLEGQGPETVLIDVRNRYEWEIGHFKGADLPPFETFREFPAYAENLKETVDPKKCRVMMYCTGGIRCELYSALMKDIGFEEVYQLHGGIIQYGLDEGNTLWDGKLYVFDDRMAVPISDDEHTVIGRCFHCGKPDDTYYNCANMDCNHLFVSCPECFETKDGCCKKDCQEAPRRRPRNKEHGNKPFRKWYKYLQQKSS